MTKEQIQFEIRRAIDLTDNLLAHRPNDEDLLRAKQGLDQAWLRVLRHWPLPPDERTQINMGLYAVRVLEGGPYGDLPEALVVLDAHLKQD